MTLSPVLTKATPPTTTLRHSSGIQVSLIDWMGDDLRIVNAAKVSFRKHAKWIEPVECDDCGKRFATYTVAHKWPCERSALPGMGKHFHLGPTGQKRLDNASLGILNAMMKHRHGTPYEQVVFTFHVEAPIGVVWEWIRHRISSFNVASTRYVEWEKSYYTPQEGDWRRQIGKAMRYEFQPIDDGSEHAISVQYELAMEAAFNSYDLLLKLGLAKEVARNVLPMGAMTEFYWTVNLRSLLNFLSLRTAPNALREIQLAAGMVEELTSLVVPNAMAAWNTHGRMAP